LKKHWKILDLVEKSEFYTDIYRLIEPVKFMDVMNFTPVLPSLPSQHLVAAILQTMRGR
jgi:hypothetical protein